MKYSTEIDSDIEHIILLEKELKRLKSILRKKQLDTVINTCRVVLKKRVYVVMLLLTLSMIIAPYVILPINRKYTFVKHITVATDSTVLSHEKFLSLMGQTESGNNYKCINSSGYCGKYQMGRSALIEIGMGAIRREDFLEMPELQEISMTLLLRKNKQYLQPYIGKFNSKTIKGIYITESGLLAGAHLGGASSVQRWLDSNGENDFKDGNGTPVSKYIKLFSGYQLKL